MEVEERIQNTKKKQQKIMGFLAKAFRSPLFVQQYTDRIDKRCIEIGQKRRLTMSTSVENLEEAVNISEPLDCTVGDKEDIQLKSEDLFSSSEAVLSSAADYIWEEFLNGDENAIVGDDAGWDMANGGDVEVDELIADASTTDWDGII